MKKRILCYHYRYLPLSETFIYNQLRGLDRFFDLDIITRDLEYHSAFNRYTPKLVPQQNLLRKLFRSEERFFLKHLSQSDLFHVNFGHMALPLQHYARKAGIPMTVHFHGVDASEMLRNPSYVEALKNSSFRAAFVCSEDMRARLMPYLPEEMPCIVSYYGTPVEKFTFKQRRDVPDGAIFLQVSRIDQKKGIDVSLKAFKMYLREIDPKATFVVAGDGPLAADLKVLAQNLGISSHVHFIGAVSYRKVLELLHSADVFLHPSVTDAKGDMEGIPNTICEAMATGLPVVSTVHSGIPELIDHSVNGFLAEEGDAHDLFEQMRLLRKTDVASISREARQKVESKFESIKTTELFAENMKTLCNDGVGLEKGS